MRISSKIVALATAFTTVASVASAQPASGQQRLVRTGTLQCDVSAGLGLIIGSSKEINCLYRPTRGRAERYQGAIRHIGLDVGVTARGVMIWAVFAPSRPGPFALAGNYVGGSAEATVGVGAGANALVGGSSRTIALQPVSVQAQLGLNAAIGVAELRLRPSEAPARRRGAARSQS